MEPSPLNYSDLPVSPRAVSRRNRLIAVVAIFLGLIASVWFLNWRNDEYNLSRQRLEENGDFRLPAGVTHLKSHLNDAHGYIIAARFDIPASQMNTFIASFQAGRHAGTLGVSSDVFPTSLGDSWWTPGHPSKCVGISWSGSEVGGLMVDQTNPTIYTVWFVNMDNSD